MDETSLLRGRCLCGAVQFALEPPLDFVSHCHCLSCRRAHGAAFVTWTSVGRERFRFEAGGEMVRWYASSATIEWGFCPRCGSSMLYRAVAGGHPEAPRTDAMYVAAASLDGPLGRDVAAHVSFEERVDWFHPADDLPKLRAKTDERIASCPTGVRPLYSRTRQGTRRGGRPKTSRTLPSSRPSQCGGALRNGASDHRGGRLDDNDSDGGRERR